MRAAVTCIRRKPRIPRWFISDSKKAVSARDSLSEADGKEGSGG